MQHETDTLRDHIDQLQVDCDRFLEEKASDTATTTQLETKLATAQSHVYSLEGEMGELRQKYWSEQEEWKQFQSDLQMAVVIANEIKVCEKLRFIDLNSCWFNSNFFLSSFCNSNSSYIR